MTTKLPKLSGRCLAVDANGRQCRARATHHEKYHGDGEIYPHDQGRSWVAAAFCDIHRSLTHAEKLERAKRRAKWVGRNRG